MRHRYGNRKLSKPTDQRLALLYGGAASLIKYGKISSYVTRLKEIKKVAEKLITAAKKGDVHSRRKAFKVLRDRTLVKALFDMAPRFASRPGGYTRITKVGVRLGDARPIAKLEFVD